MNGTTAAFRGFLGRDAGRKYTSQATPGVTGKRAQLFGRYFDGRLRRVPNGDAAKGTAKLYELWIVGMLLGDAA
jgi:hypothetical protein